MQLYEPNFKSILGDTVPHTDSVIRSCIIGQTVWSSGGRFKRKAKEVCGEPLSAGILCNSSTSMQEFEIKDHFESLLFIFFRKDIVNILCYILIIVWICILCRVIQLLLPLVQM